MVLKTLALAIVLTMPALGCRNRERPTSEGASISSITAAKHPLPTATVQPTGPNPQDESHNMERVASYGGMSTPANVYFDAAADRYLVSNVGGKLTGTDGDGFISVVTATGAPPQPKWIAGGQNGVTLNAPKGLVIANGTLYVADIDVVRTFDAKTGAPRGDVRVPGALYLAGMTVGVDGRVLVADAGMRVEDDGTLRKVTDGGIWSLGDSGRTPTAVAATQSLGGPSALSARADGTILVATLGDGSVYVLDRNGRKQNERRAPKGKLDGIGEIGNKIYVSSWDAAAVYRKLEGGTYAVQLANLGAPGGLAVDTTRNRLVVPLLTENRVDVFLVE